MRPLPLAPHAPEAVAASRLAGLLASFDDAAPLSEAYTLPGPFYTDASLYALERKAVFAGTWQLAARADQLRESGQFVTTVVGGEPVVVVRGDDGVLRAFFNVCRHHAAAVATECEGRASRFRCPYHGWTYGLGGELRSMTEFEGVTSFDKKDFGLVPLAVDTWENLVFVHTDPDPMPLAAHVGSLAQHMAPLGLAGLTFYERREYEIGCNWKVFVDNYLDGGYHIPFMHRGLNSIIDYQAYRIENIERFCVQSSPIDGRGGEAMTAAVRKGEAFYYWLYPNLMLNWYEGYLDTNFVVPLGVDRMKVVFDFYFADVSAAAAERNRASMDVSERIQDEDHGICESVQRGLSSRAYGAGRLSVRREAGENLFHRLLVADLRRSLANWTA